MIESHEDNLSSDYKEKPKREAKWGSQRGLIGVLMLALLAGVGALMYFAWRPMPKTVMEFPVQPYLLLGASSLPEMVATTGGFAVLARNYNGVSLNTFLVNLNQNQVLAQASVPVVYSGGNGSGIVSAALSPNLDILWSNHGNITMFMSSDGVRQTVALNAPTLVAFSGDGSRFALLTSLGEIVVYDTASRAVIYELLKSDYFGVYVTLNNDGTKLLISGVFTNATLYDLSGAEPQLINMAAPALVAVAQPTFLASDEIVALNYASVIVVRPDSVKTIHLSDMRCASPTQQIKISSDEKYLAIMGGRNICLMDLSRLLASNNRDTVNMEVLDLSVLVSANPFSSSIAFSSDNQTIGVYTLGSDSQPRLFVVDVASMIIVAKMDTAP